MSAEEYQALCNRWDYSTPFDDYWLDKSGKGDCPYQKHKLEFYSNALPNNSLYEQKDGQLYYFEDYDTDKVKSRKDCTPEYSKTQIISKWKHCYVTTRIPEGIYYLLPYTMKSIFTESVKNHLGDYPTIFTFIDHSSFKNVYIREDIKEILFL